MRSPAVFLIAASAAAMAALIGCSPATGPAIPPELLTMQESASAVSAPALAATLPASWDENWFSSPAVYDLDNDGIPEIVFTTYAIQHDLSNLVILDAAGRLLHRISIPGRGSMAAPTLADVDNDGILEIVVSLKDALGSGLGGVRIWRVASAIANRLDWPTGRGNYLRTGVGMH